MSKTKTCWSIGGWNNGVGGSWTTWFLDFNKCGAWNKRGGAKFGSFLISVVAEITEFVWKFLRKLIAVMSCLFGREEYLSDIIPQTNHLYNTCSLKDVTICCSRTDAFKYSFFPSTILEWNKIDKRMRQSTTMLSFKIPLLEIGRPTPKPVYNILDPNGLKLMTWP